MSRLHDADNMVQLKYVAPENNVVVGSTCTVTYAESVDTAQDNTLYAIFVQKGFTECDKIGTCYPTVDWVAMKPIFEAQNFTGESGCATVVNKDGKQVVVVGLGEKPHNKTVRDAAKSVMKTARDQKREQVVVYFPKAQVLHRGALLTGYGKGVKKSDKTKETETINTQTDLLDVVIRGLLYPNWDYDLFLPEAQFVHIVKKVTIVGETFDGVQKALAAAVHGAESVTYARELGSHRFSVADNTYMKNQVLQLAQAHPEVFKVKVLDREQLLKEDYNLICAVNQASVDQCYLAVIEYTPPNFVETEDNARPHAFVAKTLTFDTGGLQLKPCANMMNMHCDKHAGCNQLGLFRYLGLTRPSTSTRLVGVWCITDNEIGSKAVHPHTIVATTSVHGYKMSVSIDGPDAEGRLALADGVTLVQKCYNPSKIMTSATLTGAVMVSLGHYMAGLFTNSPTFPQQIKQIGEVTGENFWQLPILEENHTDLKGIGCTLKNLTGSSWMGSSTAAAFIEAFVGEDVEFVHLDIAGVSSVPGNGAVGTPVSTLQKYAELQ